MIVGAARAASGDLPSNAHANRISIGSGDCRRGAFHSEESVGGTAFAVDNW
jgi:hypothetical protein